MRSGWICGPENAAIWSADSAQMELAGEGEGLQLVVKGVLPAANTLTIQVNGEQVACLENAGPNMLEFAESFPVSAPNGTLRVGFQCIPGTVVDGQLVGFCLASAEVRARRGGAARAAQA